MARIAGVDLPREKRVEIGLTYIYGIGRKLSNDILEKTGINPDTRVKDLTEDEAAKLREVIERDYVVEGDLRFEAGSLQLRSRLHGTPSFLRIYYTKKEGSATPLLRNFQSFLSLVTRRFSMPLDMTPSMRQIER